MNEKLLPCPFCGGEAEHAMLGLVFCPDCGATIDVNNWNIRAERTCHKTGRPVRGLINAETAHCSECGAEIVTQTNEYTAKYCFCCGARLVAQ